MLPDDDSVWEHVPGGYWEEKEETDREDDDLRAFQVQRQAREYVLSHEARELAKRAIAEKAALERGPLAARVLNREQLRSLKLPKHLMRDVLYTGAVAVVLGDSQVGKSWVMQAVACCAASGLNWPEMTPNTKGKIPVLYVAAEDGGAVEWRVRHWEAAHGRAVPSETFHVFAEPINLLDDIAVEEICHLVKELGIRLVVADTVSATFGGEEETNENFSRLVRNCRLIATAMNEAGGGSVVLVHHFGKDKEKGGRGGSALFNDCDIVWELTGTIDDITMTNKKWKVDEKRRTFKLYLNKADRDAPHICAQERSTSVSIEAPPDEFMVMSIEIERACRDMADQNQGYGPSGRAIIGYIRERGSTFKTQRLNEQLAVMIATGRILTRTGPRGSTYHRLPPIQEQLNDEA